MRFGPLVVAASQGVQVAAEFFDVSDYGAVGDGVADDSAAIAAAFAACSSARGGRVHFGAGRYLTAPWDISCSDSVVELHPNATVVAPNTSKGWPMGPDCLEPSQGKTSKQAKPFVMLSGVRNVTITGGGAIDASGEMFWRESCGNWWCPKWSDAGLDEPYAWRPYMMQIAGSESVTIDNISFINPPFWCIVPTHSRRIVVKNSRITAVTSTGSLKTPNTDGIEPMWTTDVHVQNVHIRNGDDCITIKSGSRDVLVEDVTCEHSHGITVGSIWYDDVTNVTYRNVAMKGCSAGPRIKGRSQGNATISNINFENVTMDGVKTGIQIDMRYETPGTVGENIGCTVHGASITNVSGNATDPGSFECLKDRECSNISLSNVHIKTSKGWNCEDAGFDRIDDISPAWQGCSNPPSPPVPVPWLNAKLFV